MIVLNTLFDNLADFSLFASGVDTSVTFVQLNSAAISAKKQIISIITSEVYKAILNDKDKDSLIHLKSAMANLTLAKDSVFDILRKRKNDVDVYKTEQERILRLYNDNYYNAMDSLIYALEEEKNENWKTAPYCKLLSDIKIQKTDEFNNYYPIDNSYLFFFRCIPFQKEVLKLNLKDFYSLCADRKDLIDNLNSALCLLTVAMALRRLDPMEFPGSIRNLLDSSTSQRQVVNEQTRMISLATELTKEADDIISSVDVALSSNDKVDTDIEASFNHPNDGIYMMP